MRWIWGWHKRFRRLRIALISKGQRSTWLRIKITAVVACRGRCELRNRDRAQVNWRSRICARAVRRRRGRRGRRRYPHRISFSLHHFRNTAWARSVNRICVRVVRRRRGRRGRRRSAHHCSSSFNHSRNTAWVCSIHICAGRRGMRSRNVRRRFGRGAFELIARRVRRHSRPGLEFKSKWECARFQRCHNIIEWQ